MVSKSAPHATFSARHVHNDHMTEIAIDGRAQRRVTTINKLVEAHAALLRRGEVAPTAVLIADEAGVSLRTLWSAFGDMEALLQATTAHWAAGEAALHEDVDPDLDFETRLAQFCDVSARKAEFISPAARAMMVRINYSPTLQASRKAEIAHVTEFVAATFTNELASAPDRDFLTDRIAAIAGWTMWEHYRHDLGYSVKQARRQLEQTLLAMLAPLETRS